MTTHLLDKYGLEYTLIGKNRPDLISKAIDLIKIDKKVYDIAKGYKPDIFLGRATPSLAHVSSLLKKPYISFSDTEHAKANYLLAIPFATNIVTPACFTKDLGRKQVRINSYFELAYLHPNRFKPDSSVLDGLNLSKDERFFIIRFVSWKASHDVSRKGLSTEDKRELVKQMSRHGRVLISSESKLPSEFEENEINISPDRIHDLLYYSSMYVGEGATMASEAGILGTPSFYLSSLVGTMGNFIDLEKYGLVYSFRDSKKMLPKIRESLEDGNLKREWGRRRKKLLEDKIDATSFMIWFIEDYPRSLQALSDNPSYQQRFK
jgi:uncharacterized protein